MPDTKLHFTRSDGDHVGGCVLRLTGPLVMATVTDFQNYLRKETAQSVILDFSEVPVYGLFGSRRNALYLRSLQAGQSPGGGHRIE